MNLTIIRGLPGSGKTTMAYSLADHDRGDVVVEADLFFENESGEYNFDQSKLTEAHNWCREQVIAALREGKRVFVSNTFTTFSELRPYFDIAKNMFGITPTVITCQNNWGSVHDVPVGTWLNMKKRFAHDVSALFEEYRE